MKVIKNEKERKKAAKDLRKRQINELRRQKALDRQRYKRKKEEIKKIRYNALTEEEKKLFNNIKKFVFVFTIFSVTVFFLSLAFLGYKNKIRSIHGYLSAVNEYTKQIIVVNTQTEEKKLLNVPDELFKENFASISQNDIDSKVDHADFEYKNNTLISYTPEEVFDYEYEY